MFKSKLMEAGVCALLLMPSLGFGNVRETRDSLEMVKAGIQKSIDKANQEIRVTDSLMTLEAKRFEILKARHAKDVERRKEEITELDNTVQATLRDIQKQLNAQIRIENSMKNNDSYTDFLGTRLLEYARQSEKIISASLPHEREKRMERISALVRDLELGNASNSEGFSRLKSIINEEIRFGDEVSLASTSVVRLDGKVVNVRMLKIGNQWMVYVDEEETSYGVLQRKNVNGTTQYFWKEDLTFTEREQIRNAIDVKMAKKAPTMVTLPLSLSVSTGEIK